MINELWWYNNQFSARRNFPYIRSRSSAEKSGGRGGNEKNKTENGTIKPLSTLSVPCMKIQGRSRPTLSPLPTPMFPAFHESITPSLNDPIVTLEAAMTTANNCNKSNMHYWFVYNLILTFCFYQHILFCLYQPLMRCCYNQILLYLKIVGDYRSGVNADQL